MKVSHLVSVLFLCLASTLLAQIPAVKRDFLVRVERQKDVEESACIIVYEDGGFHAEHMHGKKTDVWESQFDTAQLNAVSALVNAQPFKDLDHPHAAGALRGRELDLVNIDVGRGDQSQQIRFADRNARKPFDQTLDPLLKWFADMQKLSVGHNTAVAANRCLPDDNPPPPPSPWDNPKLPGTSHVTNWTSIRDLYLIWNHAAYSWPKATKECLIVHENGAFFYQSQKSVGARKDEEIKSTSGQLTAAELAALTAELNRPELANSTNVDPLAGKFAREGEVTVILTKRDSYYQFLDFRTQTGVLGLAYGAGTGVAQSGHDGSKELGKLREWIKQSIGNREMKTLATPSGECW